MEDYKIKLEIPFLEDHTIPTFEERSERSRNKQPIISNGRLFYPCQYCNKLFPQKLLSKYHMKKCARRSDINATHINNNVETQKEKNPSNKVTRCVESSTDLSNTLQDKNKQANTTENMDPENVKTNKLKTTKNDCRKLEKHAKIDFDKRKNIVTFSKLERNCKNEFLEKCRYCNACFRNPLELLRHKRTHNSDKIILPIEEIEKYFDYPNRSYCPICKQKLKTKNFRSIFTKHLLTHTSTTLYGCVICKKQFTRKDHMRAHEKRHIVPLEELELIGKNI